MVIVKMGMFPRIPWPECESFALHRHEWQGRHGGLTQFEIASGGKETWRVRLKIGLSH